MDDIDVNPLSIVEQVRLIFGKGEFMLHISFKLFIISFFMLLTIHAVPIISIVLNFRGLSILVLLVNK